MRVGSLFSGCGGLDLGLELAGFEIAWMAERDLACRRVLERRWPGVPVLEDVRHADDWLEPVDLLAGGFPCQDLSYAGKGDGLDGDRSALWFAFADSIRLLRPRFVIVENVPGLASRGFGRVLYDLAEGGYLGRWLRLRASDLGAPHGRERIFILATDAEIQRRDARRPVPISGGRRRPSPDGSSSLDWGEFEPAIRRWERRLGRAAPDPIDAGRVSPAFAEWMLGFPLDWTSGESPAGRLQMLGNAVQVQCAELAGRILLEGDTLPESGVRGAPTAATSCLDDSRRGSLERAARSRPSIGPDDLAPFDRCQR